MYMNFAEVYLLVEAKEFEKSNHILSRAMEQLPNKWRYPYMRGFNQWYFLENKEAAAADLQKASQLPDAPAFVAGIASRLLANQDNPQTAISFLKKPYSTFKR